MPIGIKVLVALVGVVGVMGLIGAIGGMASSPGPAPTTEEPLTVSAERVYAEYHANEVNADAMFKGRLVAVDGPVADISKDFLGTPVVTLEAGGLLNRVNARFASGGVQEAWLARLTKGASARFVCRGNGMILGAPQFQDCEIR